MAEKCAVTSVCFLPKGRLKAQALPYDDLKDFDEDELMDEELDEEMEEEAPKTPEKNSKKKNKGDEENGDKKEKTNSPKTSPKKKKKKEHMTIDEEFDLDNYDSDPNEGGAGGKTTGGNKDFAFANCFNMTDNDRQLAFEDPDISPEQQESDSEGSDHDIKAGDNVFVTCACEDDACVAEVYVYDDEEESMFVHHEILLNAYPLCVDYLNMGRKDKNFMAVGQFDHNIDIWDLDIMDPMQPEFSLLGEVVDERELRKMKKKKKIAAKNSDTGVVKGNNKGSTTKIDEKNTGPKHDPLSGHTAPVMCLNANPLQFHVLASGSADHTVKLWDLGTQKCVTTLDHHKSKVQCVKWHATEPSILLTAGYDKKLSILDVRRAAKDASLLSLDADAEQASWSDVDPNLCFVSAEDGTVRCYDARKVIGGTGKEATEPLWKFTAYKEKGTACSGIAQFGNVFVTGGTDGVAKVWDLKNSGVITGDGQDNKSISAPCFLHEKNLSVGPILSCAGGKKQHGDHGSMFLFGGHTVAMWDLRSERRLCENFGWKWDGKVESEGEGDDGEGVKKKRKRKKRSF